MNLYLHFIINILNIKRIFLILEFKHFCVLKKIVLTVVSECKTEKRNSQLEHRQPMEQTRDLLCTLLLLITTPVSLLANEFDVRSVFHGQLSLAAVNQIRVIHVAKI